MTDFAGRIATASGDAGALLALCIELAQEVSRLSAEAAVLESRRAKDANRKRNTPRKSAEVHGSHRSGTETLPPSPSSSFPTPHITPSSPPIPQPPQQPQGEEEVRLEQRAPEAWPVVAAFLVGKAEVARQAWIGRFHGALDRPPHPTGQELADALQDLMTLPAEQWVPTLFRRYVERIRRDAVGAAERAAAPAIVRTERDTGEAGRMFAAIRELITEQRSPSHGMIRMIPKAKVVELGQRTFAAYEQVGGADRFLAQGDVGFLLRDFTNAFNANTPQRVSA